MWVSSRIIICCFLALYLVITQIPNNGEQDQNRDPLQQFTGELKRVPKAERPECIRSEEPRGVSVLDSLDGWLSVAGCHCHLGKPA